MCPPAVHTQRLSNLSTVDEEAAELLSARVKQLFVSIKLTANPNPILTSERKHSSSFLSILGNSIE